MSDNHIMNTTVRLLGQLDPSLAKSIQTAEKNFKKMDKTAFAVNATFVGLGVAAAKILVDATQKAATFEKQMSNVATLLDGDVNKRIGELNKEVLKVSNSTGVATETLTDGLYQVISAVGDSADATKILTVAAKAAKAGNAETAESVNLLTAVTKGYGDTSYQAFEKASDLAFQTVKLGQTTFPDLAASIGAVIPMASALGLKQEELFGGFATLTGVTGNASEVTTQLNGALKGFMKPSSDMAYVMKKLGYATGEEMLKANGLEKSLLMLKQAVGNNDTAFANLFTSIQGKKAVLAIAGAQAEKMAAKTKAMYEATGIANEAFKRQKDNVESLQEDVKNLLDNGLTQLGMVVLPVIKSLLVAFLPVLEAVADHMDILIPIIAGVLTGLTTFSILQSVITLMNLWKASTIAATLANGGLVAALKAVWLAMTTNPIGWICVAIGALISIIILLVQHWATVKEAMIKVWDVCREVFSNLGTWFKEHFVDVLLTALGPIGLIIRGITTIGSKIAGIQKAKKSTEDLPKLAKGGFTNGISIAGEAGREAVISFNPAYRSDNISTWLKAGQMLGVAGTGSSNSFNLGGVTFSPNLYFTQKMSDDEVIEAVERAGSEFMDMIRDKMEQLSGVSYSSATNKY